MVEIPAKGKKTARQRLASLATGGQSGQKQASHYLEHNQMIRTGSSALIGGGTSGSGGAGSDGNGRHGEVRELVRQCFLFTNHLLLCTRTREGKLHLLEVSFWSIQPIELDFKLGIKSSRSVEFRRFNQMRMKIFGSNLQIDRACILLS